MTKVEPAEPCLEGTNSRAVDRYVADSEWHKPIATGEPAFVHEALLRYEVLHIHPGVGLGEAELEHAFRVLRAEVGNTFQVGQLHELGHAVRARARASREEDHGDREGGQPGEDESFH